MNVYYNENDPKAAAWLRQLIADGLIPRGHVDQRDIRDVVPRDIAGFDQCHFFAGIGGWAYALELAGWGDAPVWTASCPCQPFSQAGKRLGTKDPRHLWPVLRRLVGRCRPAIVFGEQVESPAGRGWLTGVRANLARLSYAVGASDLSAASVRAPQRRQRLYWVAESVSVGRRGWGYGDTPRGRRSVQVERSGAWHDYTVISNQKKTKRIKSGIQLLVNGVPGQVDLLRGYGNAIVPQVAAEFIGAFMDCVHPTLF